jgi:cytochrome c oxidase subunit 2
MRAGEGIIALGALSLSLTGCAGSQSALDPGGPQASRISSLWWLFFGICAVVYLIVIALTLWPAGLRNSKIPIREDAPVLKPDEQRNRRFTIVVATGVGITASIVFALSLTDFFTQRALGLLAGEKNPLRIRVTGQQWWWRIEYQNGAASNSVTAANEFHIPVGRAVQLELQSSDVIHSFWVPNLHGKRDLVTGHPTKIWIKADHPGRFEGQCAEFCGLQHAKMRLIVVAEPQDAFDGWYKAQLQTAAIPSNDEQKRGYTVFMSRTCIMCHNISGTPASGQVGPDLSHLADRSRIAGAYLQNNLTNLESWISNAQHIKAGSRMPSHDLRKDELHFLVAYLQSLK